MGLNAQNKVDSQGRKQGKWSKSYDNGNKKYEGSFENDYEVGLFKYYYEDGKLRAESVFSDKGRKTFTKSYHINGKLMSEGHYYNRLKDGNWNYFDEEGNKLKFESYKQGIKNGSWKVWDNKTSLVESIEFENNMRNGVYYKNFYERGYVFYNYVNDLRDGRFEDYYYYQKLKIQGNYKSDMKDGEWRYFDSIGNITKTQVWRSDSLLSEKVRIELGREEKYIETNTIAYFYPRGKRMFIALSDGEEISCINNFEDFILLLSLDDFIMLNKRHKVYANYSAIRGIEPKEDGEYYIILEPKSKTPIITDKESKPAMESLFR